MPKLRIAVNVSAAQFRQPTLLRFISEVLQETQLDPACLELEVTESVVMYNPEETTLTLSKLREMGIHISIDDFGTGYSSLSYLKKLPIDTLKVDRSFVKDVIANGDDAAILPIPVRRTHGARSYSVSRGTTARMRLTAPGNAT